MRWILLGLALHSVASGQDLKDLLPPGVGLDDAGKLHWAAVESRPCRRCEGTKTVYRPLCGRRAERAERAELPTPCGFCRERKLACPSCLGEGKTPDPYVSTVCEYCGGNGFVFCPACRGARRVVTPKDEHDCAACGARGAFVCPLCAGKGRLPCVRVGERDVRKLSASELEAADAALTSLAASDRSTREATEIARDRFEDFRILSDGLRLWAPLPEGPVDRLRTVVDADEKSAPKNRGEFEVVRCSMMLRDWAAGQRSLTERARWLLRRNAEGVASRPVRKAADVTWTGIFGEDGREPGRTLCLLGRGFLRTRMSEDLDATISAWRSAHPEAVVVEVCSIPARPGETLAFVWVVDGAENLGVHLVRRGSAPGGTMRATRPEIDVSFEAYRAFLRSVRDAETNAKQEKLGIWADDGDEVARQVQKAEKLRSDGNFEAAAEAFGRIAAASKSALDGQSSLDYADCLAKLKRFDEALAIYDRAIGDGSWWPPYLDRARSLEQARGTAAAVAWLESLKAAEPGTRKFHVLLGAFHAESGRCKDAVPHYEEALRIVQAASEARFDAAGWLTPNETRPTQGADLDEFWPLLEDLARCRFQTGDLDGALRAATMGVAAGRKRSEEKGVSSKDEVEAGDGECRVIRARVFLARGAFDDAAREVRYAKISFGRGGTTNQVAAAEALEAAIKKARAAPK